MEADSGGRGASSASPRRFGAAIKRGKKHGMRCFLGGPLEIRRHRESAAQPTPTPEKLRPQCIVAGKILWKRLDRIADNEISGDGMLPDRYLVAGLDALARSHPTSASAPGFGDGHRGAAMLSAYFMLKDGLAEAQAEAPIRTLADHWTRLPVFAPMPPEPTAPRELDRLLSALGRAFGTDQAHGVIFPSLALRAFSLRPDLITRARVDGLVRIAEAYTPTEPPADPLPDQPIAAGAFADQVLAGFVASAKAYRGFFQGYSFHLLTFGQAIHDLHALGYAALARRAELGFRVYLADCALGPSGPHHDMAFPVTDPPPQSVRPEHAGFWLSLTWGPEFGEGLGHIIKYAYAFTSLGQRATDPDGLARARELYYLSAWG